MAVTGESGDTVQESLEALLVNYRYKDEYYKLISKSVNLKFVKELMKHLMTDKFPFTVRRVRGQERAALQDEERLRAVPGGRRRLDQEEPRRLPQEQGELRCYDSLLGMGRC